MESRREREREREIEHQQKPIAINGSAYMYVIGLGSVNRVVKNGI
jgi:hypothetical protein